MSDKLEERRSQMRQRRYLYTGASLDDLADALDPEWQTIPTPY